MSKLFHSSDAYERVDFADWTWIADSYEDVFGNLRTYPLGVPLCCGCDGPVTDGKCDSCEVEFVRELARDPHSELRPEHASKWDGERTKAA